MGTDGELRKDRSTLLATLLTVAVTSCGSAPPPGDPFEFTATIGPQGGTVAAPDGSPYAGLALKVPPGALATSTRVILSETSDPTPLPSELARAIGPQFDVRAADGQDLLGPAELTLPMDRIGVVLFGQTSDQTKVWVRAGDSWVRQEPVATSERTVTISLAHFAVAGAGVLLTKTANYCYTTLCSQPPLSSCTTDFCVRALVKDSTLPPPFVLDFAVDATYVVYLATDGFNKFPVRVTIATGAGELGPIFPHALNSFHVPTVIDNGNLYWPDVARMMYQVRFGAAAGLTVTDLTGPYHPMAGQVVGGVTLGRLSGGGILGSRGEWTKMYPAVRLSSGIISFAGPGVTFTDYAQEWYWGIIAPVPSIADGFWTADGHTPHSLSLYQLSLRDSSGLISAKSTFQLPADLAVDTDRSALTVSPTGALVVLANQLVSPPYGVVPVRWSSRGVEKLSVPGPVLDAVYDPQGGLWFASANTPELFYMAPGDTQTTTTTVLLLPYPPNNPAGTYALALHAVPGADATVVVRTSNNSLFVVNHR